MPAVSSILTSARNAASLTTLLMPSKGGFTASQRNAVTVHSAGAYILPHHELVQRGFEPFVPQLRPHHHVSSKMAAERPKIRLP